MEIISVKMGNLSWGTSSACKMKMSATGLFECVFCYKPLVEPALSIDSTMVFACVLTQSGNSAALWKQTHNRKLTMLPDCLLCEEPHQYFQNIYVLSECSSVMRQYGNVFFRGVYLCACMYIKCYMCITIDKLWCLRMPEQISMYVLTLICQIIWAVNMNYLYKKKKLTFVITLKAE